MTYRGHVKNGQILLDEPVVLPEGAEVRIEVAQEPAQNGKDSPSVWDELLDLAGTVHGLPVDAAKNHDHYLYGTPKKP
jgi:hypothetical protein